MSDSSEIDALYEAGFFGPAALETCEFRWTSLMGALLRYRDDEGRPLGEEVAPSSARRGVAMKMRTCPYPGSRHDHERPMNVSALRQFTEHWPAVVGAMLVLRERYLAHVPRPDAGTTLSDLWKTTRLGIILPAYLLRRAERPLGDGQIPAVAAILYRMMLGVNRIAHVRLLMTLATGMSEQMYALDPAVLHAFTDRSQLLVGNYSVCAGPPAMIEETFRIMARGAFDTAPRRAVMEDLCDPRFLTYASLFLGMELEKYLYAVRSACLARDLTAAVTALAQRSPQAAGTAAVLVAFEEFCATRTSTLAQEVARADAVIRARIDRGLTRLRDELDDERRSLCGQSFAALWATADDTPRPSACARLAPVLAASVPDREARALVEDALAEYIHLERRYLAIFDDLQARLDRALGVDATPAFTSADLTQAFGPRLTDLARESLALTIESRAGATRITARPEA